MVLFIHKEGQEPEKIEANMLRTIEQNYRTAANKLKEVDSKILFAVSYDFECAKTYYYKNHDRKEFF